MFGSGKIRVKKVLEHPIDAMIAAAASTTANPTFAATPKAASAETVTILRSGFAAAPPRDGIHANTSQCRLDDSNFLTSPSHHQASHDQTKADEGGRLDGVSQSDSDENQRNKGGKEDELADFRR